MPTVSVPQLSFVAGEWSPSLYGRSDLSRARSAVRVMKNFYCKPHGPVTNRGGTKYVGNVHDSTKKTRLIPFEFSVTQSYALEFSEQKMRVIKSGALVVTGAGVWTDIVKAATYKWTASNPASIVSATYQWASSAGGTNEYYLQLNGGADPSITVPTIVAYLGTSFDKGTLGSLAITEWGFGDNVADGIGYDTIYIRLADGADPDSKATGSVTYSFECYLELLAGGNPRLPEPTYIYENGSPISEGTMGVLTAGALYDYGDNDSLGYNTVYVRLTDKTDPNGKADGYVEHKSHTSTSLVNATYKWTASGSGTNEYYCELAAGGDPSISVPINGVYINLTAATEGTVGSLAAGEWDYGDGDTLGYSTIYVRLTGGGDPDSQEYGYIEASYYVELTLPYTEANDIFLINYEQSADTMYLAHPEYAVRKLTRSAHDNWKLTTISFGSTLDAPTGLIRAGTGFYFVVTTVDVDGRESAASSEVEGAVTNQMTWNAVAGADHYRVYKDSHNAGIYGYVGRANSEQFTEPTGGITPDYTTTPPTAKDPFDSADNYPGVVAFFDQRLNYLRTDNKPQTFWGSKVGDFETLDFSTPSRDDDAYEFTMNALQVNEIRWAVALSSLLVGTAGGEWVVRSGSNSDAITPTSIDVKRQSNWGVSTVPPLVIGETVLFITGAGNSIRDMAYSLEADGFNGTDLSIFAKHRFQDYTIVDWCYQQDPDSTIWCVRSDGKLLGLTYYREQEVWGWHYHETLGKFKSITSIKVSSGVTEVYAIVERVIDGSTVKMIEQFKTGLPVDANYTKDVRDSYYVDCGLSLDTEITITGITSANPSVVTATSHGLSDADIVDFAEIVGERQASDATEDDIGTELNGKQYKVEAKSTHTFRITELTDTDTDLTEGVLRKWTVSASGTNEYYLELIGGGDPDLDEPDYIKEDGTLITEATVGSLTAGQWDYDDNDTLGYDTIYVRLTDNVDPDTKNTGYITGSEYQDVDGSNFSAYSSGGVVRKAVTSISGLGHLEGEEVSVLANGSVVEGKTVASGAITLPNAASRVHVGLPYTSEIETLDFDFQGETGGIQDKLRNIVSAVLRLEDTRSLKIGPSTGTDADLSEIEFRSDENYDEPTRLFSGDKEELLNSGDERESRIVLKNSDPLPVTIVSLIARVDFEEIG